MSLSETLEKQRPNFFLWSPIILGTGIGLYFTVLEEPTSVFVQFLSGFVFFCGIGLFYLPLAFSLFLRIFFLLGLGFLLAFARSHGVSAPVLDWHYYGPVEGRIVAVDRSASNRPRVTLDRLALRGLGAEDFPDKLRVSFHSDHVFSMLLPGKRIATTASLSPPAGPVEPGGFDFQRMAWFRGLGAVGYSRSPVLPMQPVQDNGFSLALSQLRHDLSNGIRAEIEGPKGAFAAAIVTGDRSAIDPAMLKDLRASNLAHLLAISGLHMGLLTGFIFALVRYGLALIPPLALRLPGKKIAAVLALLAGLSYLMISGANIATQRAFIMVSVMLVAVLLERPAITLRAVALAALIVLILRPESLVGAGFQMSFAATIALVSVFRYLKTAAWWRTLQSGKFRRLRPVLALVVSSAVAGLATAPFSAFHFNQVSQFGLLANLLSVPVMGVIIMPGAVVAGLAWPLGLQQLPFWLMGAGIDWILTVAAWVAALDGAVVRIHTADWFVLPVLSFSALFMLFWVGRLRWIGVPALALSALLWAQSDRPEVLIDERGRLIGLLSEGKRVLNRSKGSGFAASTWLENDGDGSSQISAANWESQQGTADKTVFTLGGTPVGYVWSKKESPKVIEEICQNVAVLIAPNVDYKITGECYLVDKKVLKEQGSMAISSSKEGVEITSASQVAGRRPWN